MSAITTKRFTLRRALGEGGVGVVYEAFDEERKVPVALKTLTRVDDESLARFKREFHVMHGIAHPNLVTLGELFCERDECFFTMELVDGVDLVTYVRRASDGSFDEAKLRAGLRQLLEALAALHAIDKVHRDVKPSNVMVTREGRVVLLDFGLLLAPSLEDSGDTAIVGTPAYMAPEQAATLDVGPPADLYAVGVILYELLTGRLPIEGPQLQMLLEKQTREAVPPASIANGVPDDLDALCVKLLRFDPLRRPTAIDALRALEARPTGGSLMPRSTTEAPPSIGRASELAELRAAYEAVANGQGELTTVLVCGDSGIGKSSLVRRFIASLVGERPDAVVLEARCDERERLPFETLDGVVDALSRRLARMSDEQIASRLPAESAVLAQSFPSMLRVAPVARANASLELTLEPHELRRRASIALRELFARMASLSPLVVAIDDLQWADDAGLRALAEMLRAPNAPSLLFVATVCTTPDGDAELERLRVLLPGFARVVNVAPLSREEARALVRSMLPRLDAAVVDPDAIVDAAGGHPLFLEELTRHVSRGGSARDGVTLDEAIAARVALLEPKTRALMELVAVAGRPTSHDVIAAAAHVESTELHRRTAVLRVQCLARMAGARWSEAVEPYHDRVQRAVLAGLAPSRLRELHEALAIAFEASSQLDAETLTLHWREGGNAGRALKYAIGAGDQATKTFAFERAAEWYERALALSPREQPGRRDLRVKLGDALARSGRGALAAAHFEAAAVDSPPMEALDLRRRAAEELLTAGRFEEGDAVLSRVLAEVGIGLPRTPLAALLGLLAFRFVLFLRGFKFRERGAHEIPAQALARLEACNGVGRVLAGIDNVRGAYFQTRSLLAALALGEPKYVAHALSIEAMYVATAGNGPRATMLMEQARAIAERTANLEVKALVEAMSGLKHFVLGRFEEALAHSDRSGEMLREHCPDATWEMRAAQTGAIWATAWLGNLNELGDRVERGVCDADDRNDLYIGMVLRTGVPNLAWLRKGDVAAARAAVLDVTRRWTQPGYHSLHYWSLMAQSRIELYEGDGRAAYRRISHEWSQVARAMVLQVRIMGVEALHLRASAALAAAAVENGIQRVRMIRAAERDARRLEGMRWSLASSLACTVRAGAAALLGDDARAANELDAGIRGYDVHAMNLHAMSARWHLGRLRGGADGARLVASVDAWMTQQGVASVSSMARMLAPGFRH